MSVPLILIKLFPFSIMRARCEDNENGSERQRKRFFMLGDKWREAGGNDEGEMRRGNYKGMPDNKGNHNAAP